MKLQDWLKVGVGMADSYRRDARAIGNAKCHSLMRWPVLLEADATARPTSSRLWLLLKLYVMLDQLVINDADVVKPEEGYVLIRNRASSVNPVYVIVRKGESGC